MKIYLLLLILFSLKGCSTEELNKDKNMTVFRKYIIDYENGDLNESNYFNSWINIPSNEKLLVDNKYSLKQLSDIIPEIFEENDLVAIIQNSKFKILKYDKKNDIKNIMYSAKIIKCYKGICADEIKYLVTKEIDDSFYPDGSQLEIVFLEKINNQYYSDIFLRFSDSPHIRTLLDGLILKK